MTLLKQCMPILQVFKFCRIDRQYIYKLGNMNVFLYISFRINPNRWYTKHHKKRSSQKKLSIPQSRTYTPSQLLCDHGQRGIPIFLRCCILLMSTFSRPGLNNRNVNKPRSVSRRKRQSSGAWYWNIQLVSPQRAISGPTPYNALVAHSVCSCRKPATIIRLLPLYQPNLTEFTTLKFYFNMNIAYTDAPGSEILCRWPPLRPI